METPMLDGRKDHGGIADRRGPNGKDGRGQSSPRSGDPFDAFWGADAWRSAFDLMSWGQDQVERMMRMWVDQARISTEQPRSTSGDVAIEERQVDVGGLGTRYLTAGEGPPLVLLHGDGHSARSWLWVIPALARRHKVYAPFLPGFGTSADPVDCTPKFLAGFLREFLDALGIGQATLVGNSTGGLVALHLALSDPQRVATLVLVDSAGLGREVNPALAMLTLPGVGEAAVNLTRTPLGAAQRVWLYVATQFWRSERVPKEWLVEHFGVPGVPGFLEATVRVKQVMLSPLGQVDVVLDELPRLTMPTLVLWGANDLVVPVHHGRAAAARLPHARLEVIPDCGHLPQLERPDRFVSALRRFLAEHAA